MQERRSQELRRPGKQEGNTNMTSQVHSNSGGQLTYKQAGMAAETLQMTTWRRPGILAPERKGAAMPKQSLAFLTTIADSNGGAVTT